MRLLEDAMYASRDEDVFVRMIRLTGCSAKVMRSSSIPSQYYFLVGIVFGVI